jgi:hypothetical protein
MSGVQQQNHSARAHAKYSGSNAYRFRVCAGQPNLAAQAHLLGKAPGPSKYAEEGTRAHELLERCMRDSVKPVDADPSAPEEMQRAVLDCIEYVDSVLAEYPHALVRLETRRNFPQTVVPEEDAGGTIDILLWDEGTRKGWVIDFKFGAGQVVEASAEQLYWYATQAFWFAQQLQGITLVVVQPRGFHPAGPVREHHITAADLAEFQALAEGWIEACEAPDAPLVPGDHCRWCDATMICPAREAAALAVAQLEYADLAGKNFLLPHPADLGLDRVAHILDGADLLRQWLADVESYALQQAHGGKLVPGWKLVEGQRRRRWDGAPQDIAAKLVAMSGFELTYDDVMPRKLVPLTTAEEMLAKACKGQDLKWEFAKLTVKESKGALTLAPESDPRPARDRARDSFEGVVIPPMPEPGAGVPLWPGVEMVQPQQDDNA